MFGKKSKTNAAGAATAHKPRQGSAQTKKRASRPGSGFAPQELIVDGVRVIFTRKRVKNINMRVKRPDGHVEVSAPIWVSTVAVEAFVREKMGWIKKRQSELPASPYGLGNEATPEDLSLWRKNVSAATEELVAHWEPIMGVKVGSLVYRNMTSRWGSCNPATGRVCINLQLANYPSECLEYVVVHELCHLLERGHGPRFKELMSNFLPDWQERRALLKH